MSEVALTFTGAIIFAAGFFIGRKIPIQKEQKTDMLPLDFEKRILEATQDADIPENTRKQWVNWLSYDGKTQDSGSD